VISFAIGTFPLGHESIAILRYNYRKVESPRETATSTSDYFGVSNKPKRSEPVKVKPAAKNSSRATPPPKKATPTKTSAKSTPNINGNGTPIRTKPPSQPRVKVDDDLDNDDDIFKSDFKTNGKNDDYEESEDDKMEVAPPKKTAAPRATKKTKFVKEEDDFELDDDDDIDMKDVDPEDDEVVKSKKPSKAAKASVAKKRKSPPDDDEEEDESPKKSRKKAAAPAKSPAKKKAKKDDAENAATQAIFDSITKIRPPTPPPRDASKKFNFAAHAQHQSSLSQSNEHLEIPTGAENCLAGLNFVFTGVLANLDRTTGQNLVKRYGGKVQSSASTRTDFVVLGADAGPKKLEVIRDNNLKTIDENGLFELIKKMPANGGSGKAAAAFKEKQAKEQEKVRKMAEEMEKEDKKLTKAAAPTVKGGAGACSSKSASSAKPAPAGPDSRLWTVKYAPTSISQICGNKSQVEKLQNWLRNFPKNHRKGFKMPGKDGSGVFRAVIIYGPPGIGKTTAAHVVAKEEGYDVVETNASDTRSKRLMEESLRGVLNTTSLMGYFAGDNKKVEGSKKKMCLVMDEVDGMTGSDRGGVGALAKVCKTSEIPIILICNDRKLPKMKPFDYVTYDLPFRRPTTDQIRARMMSIAFREKLDMPPQVLNALIEGSGADIRQVVNMLSTSKLGQKAMDFDKGKAMSKAWEKHVILKPWDIVGKILGGAMFADSSKATLNDKVELYFNDHEFSYLMLQENYLGTFPMKASNYSGKEKNLKVLELVSDAADSISDGDLVDRMIHGSQQQWSLMPTHAIFSFVRPASFVAGSLSGYGQTRFTSWLGQNSKQGRCPLCHNVEQLYSPKKQASCPALLKRFRGTCASAAQATATKPANSMSLPCGKHSSKNFKSKAKKPSPPSSSSWTPTSSHAMTGMRSWNWVSDAWIWRRSRSKRRPRARSRVCITRPRTRCRL
jgi:replication factor C subunit 1